MEYQHIFGCLMTCSWWVTTYVG